MCGQNGPGPKKLCPQISQTEQSHKTPETKHGLAAKRIFSGSLLGPLGPQALLHGRVCRGGSYAPELYTNNMLKEK